VLAIATLKDNPINEQIRCKEMMVIGPNGEQLGVKSKQDALTLAGYAGFDLVLMSDSGNMPVCKTPCLDLLIEPLCLMFNTFLVPLCVFILFFLSLVIISSFYFLGINPTCITLPSILGLYSISATSLTFSQNLSKTSLASSG
jgi:hypothetical protein